MAVDCTVIVCVITVCVLHVHYNSELQWVAHEPCHMQLICCVATLHVGTNIWVRDVCGSECVMSHGHVQPRTHMSCSGMHHGHVQPRTHMSCSETSHGHVQPRTHMSCSEMHHGHVQPRTHMSCSGMSHGHLQSRTNMSNPRVV